MRPPRERTPHPHSGLVWVKPYSLAVMPEVLAQRTVLWLAEIAVRRHRVARLRGWRFPSFARPFSTSAHEHDE